MSGCSDPPSSTKVGRRFRPPLRSPALLLLARPASPVTTQTHSEVITVSSDLFGAASAEVHRDASSKQVRTHTPTLTLNIPGGNLDSTSLSPHTPGSVRLLSSLAGSARSSCVDLLNPPLPNQAFERPLLTPRDEGDVPLNTASTSGSYFPSLRRQISNLSLRSATSSIKRFVFGPDASLPQIETTPALGKIESSKAQALTDSLEIVVEASKVPVPVIFEPSGSSPVLVNVNTESPKSTFLVDLPESEAKPPQNTLHCSPPIEKFGDTPVEGPPFSQIGLPRSIAIPPRRELQTPSRSQPLTPYSARYRFGA
ncbi:hypothetical protein FRC12_002272 [Ceratobasidium sp. 428]|nr:hypothetical protein FRC12_002272 [Ceratobasidium sp. 428]